MKILMVTSEAVPFAKTGGLADAVSALSIALTELGHDVRIILPRYYKIDREKLELLPEPMSVHCGFDEVWTAVYKSVLPGKTPVPVYFIDHEQLFGRDGIYGTPQETDFHDNPERFTLLSQSAFQLCRKLDWIPDIIHAHDWSAALTPVLLKFKERFNGFEKTASIFTIHNLGYQGIYGKHKFHVTG